MPHKKSQFWSCLKTHRSCLKTLPLKISEERKSKSFFDKQYNMSTFLRAVKMAVNTIYAMQTYLKPCMKNLELMKQRFRYLHKRNIRTFNIVKHPGYTKNAKIEPKLYNVTYYLAQVINLNHLQAVKVGTGHRHFK